MTMAKRESNQPLSRDVSERRPSRMHPVKSRILDATLKNVRDKRFSVVKTVIVKRCSVLHLPCSAMVEFLPNSIASGLAPFNSALKALESSRKRVVQFVLTPTFLPDIVSATTFHPYRDNSSIEDLFDLFPSPPVYLPPIISASTENVDSKDSQTPIQAPSSPSDANKRHSLSTSFANVLLATGATVSSDQTASINTPELSQVAFLGSDAIAGAQIPSVSSLSVLPAHHEREHPVIGTTVCKIEESTKSVSRLPVIYDSPSLNLARECDMLAGEDPVSFAYTVIRHEFDNILSSLYSHLSGNGSQLTCASFAKGIPEFTRDLVLDRTKLTETELQSIFSSLELDPSISPVGSASSHDNPVNVEHPGWRQSMEKLLQAFRDVKPEDQDFRDLFYRDSSCLSRGSRASPSPILAQDDIIDACSALSPMNMGSSAEELRFRDGDSATSSSESVFEDGLFTPSSMAASTMEVIGLPSSIFGVHDSSERVGLGIRDLIQVDPPKPTSASQHRLSILTKWFSETRNTNDHGTGMDSSPSVSSSYDGAFTISSASY